MERTVPGGRGVPADVQAGAGDRLRARAVQHYAALAASGRSVIGVDIDRNKIALARQVAAGLPGADLTFRGAESGAVPAGPWDAIVIVDVLYLQPADAQRALLAEAATRLAAGGLLLVKEMSPAPEWKATWNRWQETVAVSVLGITERMARPRPPSTSSIRRQWPPGCGTRACGRRSGGWTGTDCIRTTS